MGRFVRYASIAFAVFSTLFWLTAWTFVELIEILDERLVEAGPIDRMAQAAPALIYGVLCVWFCHWFARGVARRVFE